MRFMVPHNSLTPAEPVPINIWFNVGTDPLVSVPKFEPLTALAKSLILYAPVILEVAEGDIVLAEI